MPTEAIIAPTSGAVYSQDSTFQIYTNINIYMYIYLSIIQPNNILQLKYHPLIIVCIKLKGFSAIFQNGDCDLETTIHVDAFLYPDEEIDRLCDSGDLSTHFCVDCGSRQIQPLSIVPF